MAGSALPGRHANSGRGTCRVSSLLPITALPVGFVGFLPESHTLLALDISQTNRTNQPAGPAVALEATAAQIEVWDWEARTYQAIPLRNLLPGRITSLALSVDGTQMAVTVIPPDERSRRLYSVNPRTGECAFLNLNLSASGSSCLAFSPDAHYLAVGGEYQTLLCDWPQATNAFTLPAKASVQASFFSKDGTRLMTDDMLGEVRVWEVWEVPSGKLMFVLASEKMVSSGSFSADGLTLATANGDTARV